MAGSESVFNIIQLGLQSGTAYAPGTAVAATVKYPVENAIAATLDRGSTYPRQDRGRNVRNTPGTGYHGVRGSGVTLPSMVRFGDVLYMLAAHYAGVVSGESLGGGLYKWVFPLEAVTPTIIPLTVEGGSTDASEAQEQISSALVDQLTLSFADIVAPGAFPWNLNAQLLGFDRAINDLTADLDVAADVEVAQGHLTSFSEGDTDTSFEALTALDGHLKGYSIATNRALARRAYGGTTDVPVRHGFKDPTSGDISFKLGISADSKSDFHDVWNTSGGSLGERKIRAACVGGVSAEKLFQIDARMGIFAVPFDDVDGERVYACSGQIVDDDELDAPATVTVINTIPSI